jgi:hypothetical protein
MAANPAKCVTKDMEAEYMAQFVRGLPMILARPDSYHYVKYRLAFPSNSTDSIEEAFASGKFILKPQLGGIYLLFDSLKYIKQCTDGFVRCGDVDVELLPSSDKYQQVVRLDQPMKAFFIWNSASITYYENVDKIAELLGTTQQYICMRFNSVLQRREIHTDLYVKSYTELRHLHKRLAKKHRTNMDEPALFQFVEVPTWDSVIHVITAAFSLVPAIDKSRVLDQVLNHESFKDAMVSTRATRGWLVEHRARAYIRRVKPVGSAVKLYYEAYVTFTKSCKSEYVGKIRFNEFVVKAGYTQKRSKKGPHVWRADKPRAAKQ